MSRRNRRGLRVIPRRIGDQPLGKVSLRQRKDQIRRAADLERAALLEILALEKRTHAGFGVEGVRAEHGRALGYRPNALGGLMHEERGDFCLLSSDCTGQGVLLSK